MSKKDRGKKTAKRGGRLSRKIYDPPPAAAGKGSTRTPTNSTQRRRLQQNLKDFHHQKKKSIWYHNTTRVNSLPENDQKGRRTSPAHQKERPHKLLRRIVDPTRKGREKRYLPKKRPNFDHPTKIAKEKQQKDGKKDFPGGGRTPSSHRQGYRLTKAHRTRKTAAFEKILRSGAHRG